MKKIIMASVGLGLFLGAVTASAGHDAATSGAKDKSKAAHGSSVVAHKDKSSAKPVMHYKVTLHNVVPIKGASKKQAKMCKKLDGKSYVMKSDNEKYRVNKRVSVQNKSWSMKKIAPHALT